jgi:hypothetical protein
VDGKLVDTYQAAAAHPDAVVGNFTRLFVKLEREQAAKAKVVEKKVDTKPRYSSPLDVSAISVNVAYVVPTNGLKLLEILLLYSVEVSVICPSLVSPNPSLRSLEAHNPKFRRELFLREPKLLLISKPKPEKVRPPRWYMVWIPLRQAVSTNGLSIQSSCRYATVNFSYV